MGVSKLRRFVEENSNVLSQPMHLRRPKPGQTEQCVLVDCFAFVSAIVNATSFRLHAHREKNTTPFQLGVHVDFQRSMPFSMALSDVMGGEPYRVGEMAEWVLKTLRDDYGVRLVFVRDGIEGKSYTRTNYDPALDPFAHAMSPVAMQREATRAKKVADVNKSLRDIGSNAFSKATLPCVEPKLAREEVLMRIERAVQLDHAELHQVDGDVDTIMEKFVSEYKPLFVLTNDTDMLIYPMVGDVVFVDHLLRKLLEVAAQKLSSVELRSYSQEKLAAHLRLTSEQLALAAALAGNDVTRQHVPRYESFEQVAERIRKNIIRLDDPISPQNEKLRNAVAISVHKYMAYSRKNSPPHSRRHFSHSLPGSNLWADYECILQRAYDTLFASLESLSCYDLEAILLSFQQDYPQYSSQHPASQPFIQEGPQCYRQSTSLPLIAEVSQHLDELISLLSYSDVLSSSSESSLQESAMLALGPVFPTGLVALKKCGMLSVTPVILSGGRWGCLEDIPAYRTVVEIQAALLGVERFTMVFKPSSDRRAPQAQEVIVPLRLLDAAAMRNAPLSDRCASIRLLLTDKDVSLDQKKKINSSRVNGLFRVCFLRVVASALSNKEELLSFARAMCLVRGVADSEDARVAFNKVVGRYQHDIPPPRLQEIASILAVTFQKLSSLFILAGLWGIPEERECFERMAPSELISGTALYICSSKDRLLQLGVYGQRAKREAEGIVEAVGKGGQGYAFLTAAKAEELCDAWDAASLRGTP